MAKYTVFGVLGNGSGANPFHDELVGEFEVESDDEEASGDEISEQEKFLAKQAAMPKAREMFGGMFGSQEFYLKAKLIEE